MASEIKVDTIVNAGGDNDSGIDLATNDQVKVKIANAEDFIFKANSLEVQTGSNIDMNGTELILDADADTSITADTDDQIDFKTGGSDTFRVNSASVSIVGGSAGTASLNIPAGDILSDVGSGQFEIANLGDSSSELRLSSRGFVAVRTGGSGLNAGTERMKIDSSGDLRVQRIHDNTTSGGANVRVQSDGLLQRDTSSQRYKNTINDATHGLTELLNLRSVTFKGNNDGDTIFGGLIAEEVHDAGLTEFVEYDDQNRPDALRYSNMVSLCIKAIQELKTELDNAKARITALESE